MAVSLALPRLRPDQWTIIRHPAKTKFICAGRRMGKTLMCSAAALGTVAAGGSVAWVAPTYKNAAAFWRGVERITMQLDRRQIVVKSRADKILELSNGGMLSVYSDASGNSDGMRGEAFDLVILDEAARIRPETYYDVVLPTLADRGGSLIAPSTPKGKNWFYDEYMRGLADMNEMASFHAPTNVNPLPLIQKAFYAAKGRVSERTYQEEWLAEFQDDGGTVFRNVRACILDSVPVYDPSHRYVMGVDWAQSYDYTVLVIFDATTNQMVDIDRFNQISWDVQRSRLKALAGRYQVDMILAELNSIGGPNVEALQREGLPVQGFTTTSASKAELIQALALAFEQKTIGILDNPPLVHELNRFEMERLAGGSWRYGAPQGSHDDTVIALALAWWAALRYVYLPVMVW